MSGSKNCPDVSSFFSARADGTILPVITKFQLIFYWSREKGKRELDKRRRERNRAHHKDNDIDLEIQQCGEDNVKINYDSDP
jgi:hypothetical protein